jgi:hypothetical protein
MMASLAWIAESIMLINCDNTCRSALSQSPSDGGCSVLPSWRIYPSTRAGDSVWRMSRCTHPHFRTCVIVSGYAGVSAMMCMRGASLLGIRAVEYRVAPTMSASNLQDRRPDGRPGNGQSERLGSRL